MNEISNQFTEQQLIEDAIVSLLRARRPEASICPSDAARTIASGRGDWRALMPSVRDVAAALAQHGVLRITRGDDELAPNALEGGPIRLRRGPNWIQ